MTYKCDYCACGKHFINIKLITYQNLTQYTYMEKQPVYRVINIYSIAMSTVEKLRSKQHIFRICQLIRHLGVHREERRKLFKIVTSLKAL